MLGAGAFAEVDAVERDAAAHLVGAVTRDPDLRLVVVFGLGRAVFLVAERAGRALADGLYDVVPGGAVGIDPRLGPHPPHRGQARRAEPGMGAGAPVVADRDRLALVGVEPVGHPFRRRVVGEADAGMGPVAERLALGRAAPAQVDHLLERDRLAARVQHRREPADLERPVGLRLDDRPVAGFPFRHVVRSVAAGRRLDCRDPSLRYGRARAAVHGNPSRPGRASWDAPGCPRVTDAGAPPPAGNQTVARI